MPFKNTVSQRDLKKIYSPIGKSLKKTRKSISPISFKVLTPSIRYQSIPRAIASSVIFKSKHFNSNTPRSSLLKTSKAFNKSAKVFIIQGIYPDLKKDLLERGWTENFDLASLSFNLLWARTAKLPSNLQEWQIVNHFPKNAEISTKWSLCENIRKVKNLCNVDFNCFFPKCFRFIGQEIENFQDCFKAIKACSILKEYIKTNTGIYEKIVVSIGICKKWVNLLEKNPNKKEKPMNFILNNEWRIIALTNTLDFQIEFKKFFAGKPITPPEEIHGKSLEVLEKLEKLDPQYFLYGLKSIWIVKPGRKSRGREIALFNSIESILKYTEKPQQWIVQKYIENPLLIYNKKFDIRQWVLISNSNPLTVWIYNTSYLRFTVEKYDANDINNLFMHLTNNSINKNSQKFKFSDIEGCMWHVNTFALYLKETYKENIWEEKIFPRIKDIVVWSLLSVGNLGRKNSFEVFGYDFMVDSQFKVWLIEVNSSPAMDYSTVIYIQPITTQLVQQVLRDTMKVVLGPEPDTGDFTLIYPK